MDRLDAMAAFVAVAELRGFAPAARKLRLSPSAVTRLIAGLERRLGIRLLQRTTRSVALTDAGARYLDRARAILAAIDDADAAARAEQATPTGRLVVSAPLVFGRREVAPLVGAFAARFPQVTVELTLADRMVALVEEGVDVAVRIGALADSTLRVRPLGWTRRVVVASPAYLARSPRLRRPDDLGAHALVHLTAIDPAPEWRMRTRGAEHRVAFRPALVTNSADAAIAVAIAGGGIARVLSYQVADAVRAGDLEIVLARHEPPPLPIQLVHPAARLPSASLRELIALAVETRGATGAWDFTAV